MPKIRDNETGEIYEVPVEQLSQFGYSPSEYSTFTGGRTVTQTPQSQTVSPTPSSKPTKEGIKQVIDALVATGDSKNITKANTIKTIYSDLFKEDAKPTPTQGDKNKADAFNSTTNFIANLEKHYQAGGGASFGTGPLARILGKKKTLEGKLGFNDEANTYNDQKEGFVATLKSITGDTGVLTEQDAQRLAKLLPKLGATPDEAKTKFNDIRSQIAAKFGSKSQGTTINPNKRGTLQAVSEEILPTSSSIGRDVIAGASSRFSEKDRFKSNSERLTQATRLEDAAMKETDPKRKKALLQQANQIHGMISKESGEVSKSFSQSVKDNPLLRALGGAVELTTAFEAGSLAKGAVKGTPKFLKTLINPDKVIGGARKKVAEELTKGGVKIGESSSTQKVAKDMLQKNVADYIEKPIIEKLAKGKSISTQEALDLLVKSGKKTFTKGGDFKTNQAAAYYTTLRESLRSELKKKAPDIIELTTRMANRKAAGKMIQKILFYGGLVGAGVGGATTAVNILRGKNNQGR